MRALLVLVVLAAVGATADAKFAATQGFSGKHGVNCGACHVADPVAAGPPAVVTMEGLPAAWDVNASYELRIRVAGGPSPNPIPGQPVGGFDVEADGGRFEIPASMEGLLRRPTPTEMTYTGAGTTRRDWTVVWVAPADDRAPTTARFWLAGLAANGNHIMNGPDAAGERGDRHAAATFEVPASEAAQAAWSSRPIAPPVLEPFGEVIAAFEPTRTVAGRVPDDAEGAEWRIDGGAWRPAIGAPHFFFDLGPLGPGPHSLEARTVLGERVSVSTFLEFRAEPAPGAAASSPDASPSPWPVAAMVGAVLVLLSPLILKLRR